jgi:ribonuclease VapC
MVVDTSALVAVLFREPDRDLFPTTLTHAPTRLLSAVSFLESSLVIVGRKGAGLLADFDAFLAELDIDTMRRQRRLVCARGWWGGRARNQ